MQERQYLSVIMLGPNNTEILKAISHLMAEHSCQMVNCHAITQGELYNFSFLLAGDGLRHHRHTRRAYPWRDGLQRARVQYVFHGANHHRIAVGVMSPRWGASFLFRFS